MFKSNNVSHSLNIFKVFDVYWVSCGTGVIWRYIRDTLDGMSVFKLAILIARHPFETTSVIFLTSDTDVNVTCYFSPHPPAIFFSLEKSSDLFSNTTSETLQTTTLDETKTSEFVTSGMLYKKVDKVKTMCLPKSRLCGNNMQASDRSFTFS